MSKNLFFPLLLLIGFGGITAKAQKAQGTSTQAMFNTSTVAHRVTAGQCDTTELGCPIAGTPALYTSGTWGYASGHNDDLDEAKAERFENLQGITEIFGTRMNFAFATSSGPAAKVVVKVWDEASGAPGTALHTEDLLIDDIIAGTGDVTLMFPSPIAVSGPYYIGVELIYAAGDTVALATNTDGDTAPATSWERWSGGTWYPYDDAGSWGLDIASAIYPITINGNFAVTITPPSATVIYPNSVNLVASGGSTYTWSPGATLSCTSCPNPVASPSQTITYTVVAMDSTGSCAVTETVEVVVNNVNIEDGLFGGKATAYPNPSTGQFVLKFDQTSIADLDILVTNQLGQVVYAEALKNFSGNYAKAMDLSDFANGMYTLRVTDGEKQFVQKLIFN